MNKSLYLIMPLLLNFMIIILMMIPSKLNKFHPMMLMFILILLIFFISLNINFIFHSWISFILFLTMIGGLMVIYMYITSLANNEMFYMNFKLTFMNLLKIIPMMFILFLIYMNFKWYIYINMNIEDSWLINKYIYMKNFNQLNIMYSKLNKASFFIMWYLYFSMICIMNICYKYKSPLRQLMF